MRRFVRGRPHRLLLSLAAISVVLATTSRGAHVQTPASFASHVDQLSEPGGFFDTDNLISNEQSYLHVVPALRDAAVHGGAYIGVGPDQNFSYIAKIRPSIAFIIDVRRDNLLLHLLFKALFSMAQTPVEYLSLLFGRPVPDHPNGWRKASVERLADYVESTRPGDVATAALRKRTDEAIKTFGVPLSPDDMATIDRFHRTFIAEGLRLKFVSSGRSPRPYYPTYRDLLLENDGQGHHANFLASEDDYQFVRALERRDLVIPVVGDLSGPTALVAIGRVMAERGDMLSAFYTSNVEFYLFAGGTFQRFADNVARLPHTDRSVIIRSVFGGYRLPQRVPGYYSTSLVRPVNELLQGFSNAKIQTYRDLIRPDN